MCLKQAEPHRRWVWGTALPTLGPRGNRAGDAPGTGAGIPLHPWGAHTGAGVPWETAAHGGWFLTNQLCFNWQWMKLIFPKSSMFCVRITGSDLPGFIWPTRFYILLLRREMRGADMWGVGSWQLDMLTHHTMFSNSRGDSKYMWKNSRRKTWRCHYSHPEIKLILSIYSWKTQFCQWHCSKCDLTTSVHFLLKYPDERKQNELFKQRIQQKMVWRYRCKKMPLLWY